LLNLFIIDY